MSNIFNNKRSLVIDDEEMLRKILQLEFEDLGIIVQTASNGEEALEILKNEQFDFILCDFKMPNGDGKWLLQQLALAKIKLPPFYICTGYQSFTNDEKEDLGIDDIFKKPFEIEEILEIIALKL